MNDEHFYAAVVEELRLHGPIPGLWAKAYAEANGNKQQAEALYLRYRVEQLVQVERAAASKPNQGSDDLESLYAEVSSNLAKHAPFLIGILVIIILMVVSYLK
jgi:hypothetical protein